MSLRDAFRLATTSGAIASNVMPKRNDTAALMKSLKCGNGTQPDDTAVIFHTQTDMVISAVPNTS
ncbi:hypothetical protein D3C86_2152080 [compost metagenome]